MGHKNITITRLAGNIGAQIDGITLDENLDLDHIHALYDALLTYRVIFIRDQYHLNDEIQYNFAELIGTPTLSHPTVQSLGRDVLRIDSTYSKANQWHSDVTFADRIPKISILRAVELPSYGGDTLWASTAAGYESLPKSLQSFAEDLWAVHSNTSDYIYETAPEKNQEHRNYKQEFIHERYETLHPLVRVHPETDEKVLLLGGFFQKFDGLNRAESAALFEIFQNRIIRPENTIRWNWRLGDIALWDNRATQHYGIADYHNHKRLLSRVTLAGNIPVNVRGEKSRVISGDASQYSIIDDTKVLERNFGDKSLIPQ